MAKIVKPKKTKLTGITDQSTYGFNLGAEIQISYKSEQKIKAMFRGSSYVTKLSGDSKQGNSRWSVEIEGTQYAEYEFKQVSSNAPMFLNVRGNPTKIATGFNDIPVLVKGFEALNKGNSAYNTFRFFNRLLFILLEHIPSSSPFVWEGEDRKTFERGDIAIKQAQYAWYSNDLGSPEYRNSVLNYLRACYTGNSVFEGKVKNLANFLGLSSKNWDNSDGNLNIEARYGTERSFSLNMYAKDEEGKLSDKNVERVCNLIRFDCTFNYRFLEVNKIRKVNELEERYFIECEKNGYDIGFFKWLSEKVVDKLKLPYVCALTTESFTAMLDKCGEVVGKTQRRLLDSWLESDEVFDSITKKCEALGINPKHYADAAKAIRDKTGIDIEVPKDYHVSMLFNRISGRMSSEEMIEWVKSRKSNKAITFDELKERDSKAAKAVQARFNLDTDKVVRLRRMAPVKVHKDKLFAYKKFEEVND